MADNKLFDFNARTVTSGQAEALEIAVKNSSSTAAWAGPLLIEFKLPSELVAPPVREAVLKARTNDDPRNMAALGGVVTAAAGWSVWAINEPNDHIVVIRVFNNVNQQTGAANTTPTRLDAGVAIPLRIPLATRATRTQFTMRYGYQTGRGKETRVDGSLELTPSHLGEWRPEVSLTTEHRSPTMIEPGRPVKISWSIKDGVSATLRGPLPGGNSELTLSRDRTSDFWVEEGSLTIYAVGPATYMLEVEVKGPDGQPNVQVIRTLIIDIYSADKYASLIVRPNRVLPNGQVEIDWAVWGVEKASIAVGDRFDLKLELTEQNLSRTFQGAGVWRVNARDNQASETISLTITNDPEHKSWKDATIKAVPWRTTARPAFDGKPVALAVAEGNMALLTRGGLYTARVGRDDTELKDPVFVKSTAEGKAWHALAAFGRDFVVLRQTNGNDIVLERYDAKGQRIKLPVTLPGDFQTLARRNGTVFDLVRFGNRVYVVAEAVASGRWARSAYSVRLDPDEHVRPEGLLSSLIHYRLVSFDGALYAFERGSGRMLRFDLTSEGELEKPTRAASAVNEQGVSMIKTGLLISVGSVLAVLDPAALPSLDSLAIFGLQNVVEFDLKSLRPMRKTNQIPHDLIYNPQQDRWAACGHGLRIQAGAIAAFRGGASERLWVLQPDGEMHTLTGATEELFAPDFVDTFPSKVLPPALDAKREFTLVNLSGIDLVPMDDVCRAAGLEGFSSDGVAELTTPPPEKMPHASRNTFSLSYNAEEQGPVMLRLMAAGCLGARYFLEVTLSGRGLANATSGFKRLAADGNVANVPQTSTRYPTNADVVVKSPVQLHERTALFVINSTPHDLGLSPSVGADKVETYAKVEIAYTTPGFKIFIPGRENVGYLRVDVDYTQPLDCVVSPGSEPQRSLIRINTDNINMLDAEAQHLTNYFTAAVRFDRYDGSKFGIPPQPWNVYSCQVRLKSKKVLDGVRIGDAAAPRDGQSIFVTLARPENVSKIRIVKFDTDSLETTELAAETPGGVFSLPNAIAVSDRYYYAMFGETSYHQSTHKFEYPFKRMMGGFKEYVALAASPWGNIYFVAKTEKLVGHERLPAYTLVVEHYPENYRSEIPLDPISFPVSVPPLAVSPDGKTVAVCDQGGLLVIEVPDKKVQAVRPGNLREPAHVVFSPDGQWIYCVHMTRSIGVNPRRAVAGRDITITRVRVGRLNERQTIALPNVEGNFSVTASTRKSFAARASYKEEVALTLAVSSDNKSLFVSAGTSIMKIATDSFTLQPWRATVELPCRLIFVKKAGASAYTVYALGSSYVGDGTSVDEYKTHLYAI
ncbi:MAG TPA: hypothetical protein VHU19_03480, partial [Pyrinomonadaceae bacterium]|nr:hypothetical protein [Pyrinomonadaceae bacterium]